MDYETDTQPERIADDPAARLDEIRAPDLDGIDETAPDDLRPAQEETDEFDTASNVVELIPRDGFFRVFQTAFAVPGMIQPKWQPVAIQPHETSAARDASDAVYDLLEIYYPAALKPQSATLECLRRAGPFIAAKIMVIRAIMAKPVEPQDRPEKEPVAEFKSRRAEQPEPASDSSVSGEWQPDPATYVSPYAWMDKVA